MLKRVDLTSRSLVALVEPGSCFAGTLAELVFAGDRSYMLIGQRDGDNRPPPRFRWPTSISAPIRCRTGFRGSRAGSSPIRPTLTRRRPKIGEMLDAEAAQELGLVTFALDDIDWDDEIRIFLEERASFSPDALTGTGSQSAFRRPGDHGFENLRAPDRLAELDLPAAQRGRRGGRAQALWHRAEAGFRYERV